MGTFGRRMEVRGSLEVLKPAEVLAKSTDGSWVFLPAQHGFVGWETLISELLLTAFNLMPVYWSFLQAIYIEEAVMRLLLGFLFYFSLNSCL